MLNISLVSNVSKLIKKLASQVSQLEFTMATRVLKTRIPCASSAEVENYPRGTWVFPKEQITATSNLDNKSPKEWSNQQPSQRCNKNNKHREAMMQLPRSRLNLGGNSNWTQAPSDEGSRRGLNFHGQASLALPPTIITTISGGPISSSSLWTRTKTLFS